MEPNFLEIDETPPKPSRPVINQASNLVYSPVEPDSAEIAIRNLVNRIFSFNYKKLPWGIIGFSVFSTLGLGFVLLNQPKSPRQGVVSTVAAQAIQEQKQENGERTLIQTSTKIVLGAPLEFPEAGTYKIFGENVQVGTEGKVLVTDPKIMVQAAGQVLVWQQEQLEIQSAMSLTQKALLATKTPEHMCFGIELQPCLDKIRRGFEVERADAVKANDFQGIIQADSKIKTARIASEAKFPVPDYQPKLVTLAYGRIDQAKLQLEGMTPNGISDKILNYGEGK